MIKALRPQQWIKNTLVFLTFMFVARVAWSLDSLGTASELLLRLFLVFLGFCVFSSATYLLNDVMDRDANQLHRLKRRRPIASGQVSVPTAVTVMIELGLGGLALGSILGPVLGVIGTLYLVINIAYSLRLKRVVFVDLTVVASGNVLRP